VNPVEQGAVSVRKGSRQRGAAIPDSTAQSTPEGGEQMTIPSDRDTTDVAEAHLRHRAAIVTSALPQPLVAVLAIDRPLHSSLRWPAAVLGLTAAAVHIPVIPEHLEMAPYMGVLFILLDIALVALSLVLVVYDVPLGYTAAAVVCVMAVVGYALTRMVAFPQLADDVGNWLEPLGVAAVLSETAMAVVTAVAVGKGRRRARHAA
jgi:hypothetical protein